MATITSAQSGLASASSTWVGGVVPIDGDKVIIESGHTVTLDGTYTWGNDAPHSNTAGNGAIDVYGTLRASRIVSSELIVRGWIQIQPSSGGRLDFGTPTDRIPLGVTATLTLNRTATTFRSGLDMPSLSGQFSHSWYVTFCGSGTRVRNAVLAQAVVAGATQIRLTTSNCGWQPGDLIRLPTSMDSVPGDRSSTATVASVSGDLVTLTAGLANGHKAGCRACNLTSNVLVRPWSSASNQTSRMSFRQHIGGVPGTRKLIIDDAELRDLGNATNATALTFDGQAPVGDVPEVRRAIYNHATQPMIVFSPAGLVSEDNVFLQIPWGFGTGRVQETGSTFFRLTSGFGYGSFARGSWLTNIGGTGSSANAGVYEDCIFSGQQQFVSLPGTTTLVFRRCDIGWTHGWRTQFGGDFFIRYGEQVGNLGSIVVEDCLLRGETATFETANELVNQGDIDLRYINKQRDPTQQERHTQIAAMVRDNSVRLTGASSIRITPHNFSVNLERVFTNDQSIPCAAGSSVKIILYVRADSAFFNSGNWNPPVVRLSGLGVSTAVAATAACVDSWERVEINATNSSGFDGSFTLSYNVSLKTLSGGNVWFEGTPDGLFITRVRHYGYLFQESATSRVVDSLSAVSSTVASSYTGVSIDGASKRVSFSLGTIDSLQKLYDYGQFWGTQNINFPMPWTRSGQALSVDPAWEIIEPGLDDVLWSGAKVEYNSPGAKIGNFDSCTLEFTNSGVYNFSGSNFTGSITLVNTSGGAVEVQLPSGTTVNNVGPNITVTLPQSNQRVIVNGLVTGSRVQIFDLTSDEELLNTLVTGSSVTWNDPLPATINRQIRIRVAYSSGTTAKEFIEAVIGELGLTSETSTITYLASQVDDSVYIQNAIDGSLVTGITISDDIDRMVINISGGAVSWSEIYAYNVHWLTTEEGIRDDGAIIIPIDPANYKVQGFKIRNSSTQPLSITGGFGRDSVTGTVATIIDNLGSTGNIYQTPDQVIAFSTGSGLSAAESAKLMSLNTESVRVTSTDPVVNSLIAESVKNELSPELAAIVQIQTKIDATL